MSQKQTEKDNNAYVSNVVLGAKQNWEERVEVLFYVFQIEPITSTMIDIGVVAAEDLVEAGRYLA